MLAALGFTVALLATTAYFIMGAVPLLILKHDTPMDARFVRGFFNIYYRAALAFASATSISYAVAGKMPMAAGGAVLAALALFLRGRILPKMDALGARMQLDDIQAIPGFRRTLATAIALNVVQVIAIVWSLTQLSL